MIVVATIYIHGAMGALDHVEGLQTNLDLYISSLFVLLLQINDALIGTFIPMEVVYFSTWKLWRNTCNFRNHESAMYHHVSPYITILLVWTIEKMMFEHFKKIKLFQHVLHFPLHSNGHWCRVLSKHTLHSHMTSFLNIYFNIEKMNLLYLRIQYTIQCI